MSESDKKVYFKEFNLPRFFFRKCIDIQAVKDIFYVNLAKKEVGKYRKLTSQHTLV